MVGRRMYVFGGSFASKCVCVHGVSPVHLYPTSSFFSHPRFASRPTAPCSRSLATPSYLRDMYVLDTDPIPEVKVAAPSAMDLLQVSS